MAGLLALGGDFGVRAACPALGRAPLPGTGGCGPPITGPGSGAGRAPAVIAEGGGEVAAPAGPIARRRRGLA